MTNVIRLSSILAIVTIISAYILAQIYGITKPLIEEQKKAKTQEALHEVLPDSKVIVPVVQKVPVKDNDGNVLYEKDEVLYYKGFSDADTTQISGYAFLAQGSGYSSIVETMVGVTPSGVIKKIQIISQKETPGLGAKCENSGPFNGKDWSTQQFKGKTADQLKVKQDGGDIVSITGATITSRAVTNSIRQKLQELLPKLGIASKEKVEDTI